MERVMIMGPGGAGKSTLARALGAKLGLPVIHLDVEHWLPGWTEPDDEMWRARVTELAAGDRWIIDGDFGESTEPLFRRADTVVFMDYNRFRCLARAFRRLGKYHGREDRSDLPAGCPESWDWPFYKWIWSYPRKRRPATLALLGSGPDKYVMTVRNDRETRAFLASIGGRAPAGATG